MKVSLVVATGAHEGRVIPITGPQFLIGRDPQCQLRPASQAISKLHCAILVRDGKVFVKDFGSTNGTLVNDILVQDAEVVVQDGVSVRVGPLDFRLTIEKIEKADGTPLPGGSAEAAALAAVKAATAAPKPAPRDTTPNPVMPVGSGAVPQPTGRPAGAPAKSGPVPKPAAKPASQSGEKPITPTKPGGSKESPALKPDAQETPALASSESVSDEDHDRIAAMLLGMDDDGNGNVPDGSTVMDMPSPLAGGDSGTGEPAKAGDKKDDKPKPAQTREEMSNAANDLLRKYMRRPK
jgi:predicted component of type VI protein secretion system